MEAQGALPSRESISGETELEGPLEQRQGVSVDLHHLLLYKIEFHLCCTFILPINLALKKSPRVQSHVFFDLASSDVTPQLQSVSSQRTKADTDAWGALPLVRPACPQGA